MGGNSAYFRVLHGFFTESSAPKYVVLTGDFHDTAIRSPEFDKFSRTNI